MMNNKTLFSVLLIVLGAALLIYIAELGPPLAQIYAAVVLAFFNLVFIAILFWDRWTDTPNLKIKMEGKTEILDHSYAPKVSVLNRGRKDAYNCRVSVQVFDRKSGKKIEEYSHSEPDLKSGEIKPFTLNKTPAFDGNFVSRISAETHKSKVNKIVEYNIRNNHGPIMFERGIVPYLWFHLNKHLLKKYQNEWGTEFLVDGLKKFSDQNIRKELIEKLGEIGDDKVTCQLIDCLKKDPSRMVRDRAATALGNIGDKQAVGHLLDCLKRDKVDPSRCASAIVKICNQKCDQESVKKLIAIGDIPKLLEDFGEVSSPVYPPWGMLFSEFWDKVILRNRKTPPQIRRAVAESLGDIREELRNGNIEEALIEALKDFDGDDLCGVVKALGKVGGEKALKQLETIEHDCSHLEKAVEQIQFRIYRGGDNIAEK